MTWAASVLLLTLGLATAAQAQLPLSNLNPAAQAVVEMSWGLTDDHGNELLPVDYNRIVELAPNLLAVMQDDRWGLMLPDGTQRLPVIYDAFGAYRQGRLAAELNGRWGLIDTTGRILVAHQFDDVVPLGPGFAALQDTAGQWRVWGPSGYDDNAPRFDAIRYSGLGLAAIRQGNKWGLMTGGGGDTLFGTDAKRAPRLAMPAIADEVVLMNHGFSAVAIQGAWGLIGPAGERLLEAEHRRIGNVEEAWVRVQTDTGWVLVDTQGYVVAPQTFVDLKPVQHGATAARLGEAWGWLDAKTGTWLAQPTYDALSTWTADAAVVAQNGRWGVLDRTGTPYWPLVYDEVKLEGLDLVRFRQDGLWGLGRLGGGQLLSPSYEYIWVVDTDRVAIRQDGLWALAQLDGQLLSAHEFELIKAFGDGLAPVRDGRKWGLMNRQGELVVPASFHEAGVPSRGLAPMKTRRAWGLVDTTGNWVVDADYDEIRLLPTAVLLGKREIY